MYKVIIVEDEEIEREAIKFLINEFFENKLELIAEFDNGLSVVESIFDDIPDIVLLDIHMPGLNGIKTAKILKEKWKDVEILFLTANSQFEYARQAIQIGITDFLVKPYSSDTFEDSINKVIKKIDVSKKEKLKYKLIDNNLEEIHKTLECEFISLIISNNTLDIELIEAYINLLKINSSEYFVLILKESNLENYKDIKFLFNVCAENIVSYNFLGKNIFFLFGVKKLDIEKISKKIKKNYSKCYFGKSDYFDDIKNIKKAYESANSSLNIHIKESLKQYQFPIEFEDQLYKKVIDCNKNDCKEIFHKIFLFMRNQKNTEPNYSFVKYFKQLILLIDRVVIQIIEQKSNLKKFEDINLLLENCKDLSKIEMIVNEYIFYCIDILEDFKGNKDSKIIELAKRYIELHYSENVSLNEVADYIGFSTYYFSKFFKKEVGINFKDFLTNIKINKAKELLKNGNLNISEIAYKLGYNEPNYFSLTFKKKTGLSPKEFIKQ